MPSLLGLRAVLKLLTSCKPALPRRSEAALLKRQLWRVPLVEICTRESGRREAIASATVLEVNPCELASKAIVIPLLSRC